LHHHQRAHIQRHLSQQLLQLGEVDRTLGCEQWFETIAPVSTINPVMLTRTATPRQRASKPRTKKST
jgi:hypothetical protein